MVGESMLLQMEGRDGRTLLRTMSFISTRARALRQRFVPSQRSLSDTWQYNISDAFIDDDSNLPSPAMGGSMLSLLNETLRTCEEDAIDQGSIIPQNLFRAQRSRSLDSLGSATFPNILSPQNENLTFQFPLEVASLDHQPLVPSPLGPAITPERDFAIINNKTEKHRFGAMQLLSTTKQLPEEYMSPSQNAEAILSPRYFDIAAIPKIPGPPASPKREGIARSAPRIFLPIHDYREEHISIKTKEMSTSTRSIQSLNETNMIELNIENTNHQPTTSNLYLPLNTIESIHLLSNEDKPPRYNSILKPNVLNICPEENNDHKLPSINDTELNDLDLIDHEETRDKVHETAIPKRPTKLESNRPRPKLKHQWSMDDTRVNVANYSSASAMPSMFGSETMQRTEIEKSAEKRKRFFLRKQTNSAPDSFDGGPPMAAKVKEHHSVSFCLGSVRKCRGSDSSILPPTLPEISEFFHAV